MNMGIPGLVEKRIQVTPVRRRATRDFIDGHGAQQVPVLRAYMRNKMQEMSEM